MAFGRFALSFQGLWSRALKRDLQSYVALNTVDGEQTLVSNDGSLCTVVALKGTKRVYSEDEITQAVNQMHISLSSFFDGYGHALQFYFKRDTDGGRKLVERNLAGPRNNAQRLNLEIDDILDDRAKRLGRFVADEEVYVVLWTRMGALDPQTLKKLSKTMQPEEGVPPTIDAQMISGAASQLVAVHNAFKSTFEDVLTGVRMRFDVLGVRDALRAVRDSIYIDRNSSDWSPFLPGDKRMARMSTQPFDASNLLPPRLSDQLVDREAEVLSPRVMKVGNRIMSSVDMVIGPENLLMFNRLIARLAGEREIPWRASFLIEPGGIEAMAFKTTLAQLLAAAGRENKMLFDSLDSLKDAGARKEIYTKFRLSFATWAPANKPDLLEERVSILSAAVESWGKCSVSSAVGDPLEGVMSSALACGVASTAPAGAVPMRDAFVLLPFGRDASPWDEGSVLFRTKDGRLWPYTPGSSLQTNSVNLYFAPPGYAKSVLLNTVSMALCLATTARGGAQKRLPKIAILDIGPSSSGLISLLQEALPEDRKHEAQYFRLQNRREHAINPFDTQLGNRYLLDSEKAALINLLSLVATPTDVPDEGIKDMSELLALGVEELYSKFDDNNDRGTPKLYTRGDVPVVDRLLDDNNIDLEPNAAWWSVVDSLFDAGDIHGAVMAQRYAVPLLSDLPAILLSDKITDQFGSAKYRGEEPLIEMINRTIKSALTTYSLLNSPTQFDIGDSRVISLDLDEVAIRGEKAAEKQTALVYMLGRQRLTSDFYLSENHVQFFPEKYREYHADRIREIRETPKRVVFDEFHRTKSCWQLRDQVKRDIREGRKWSVSLDIASQLFDDFDEDMVNMATGIFILGAANKRVVDQIHKTMDLSKTSQSILENELTGPKSSGAPFLARFSMSDGVHEHLLVNTLGPAELWALSTTPSDVAIRNRLYKLLGAKRARLALSKAYPGGSAAKDVEARVKALNQDGVNADEANGNILDLICDEVVRKAEK